MKECNYRNKEG